MEYRTDKGAHSVYSLQFHYVACVKYRRKALTPQIAARLKEINSGIASRFGVTIIEQETDQDHIHVLFASKPQITLSRFINSLKTVSARMLMREFPELKRLLWGGHFWSPSYFLASTGQVTLDVLKRYVESQGSGR